MLVNFVQHKIVVVSNFCASVVLDVNVTCTFIESTPLCDNISFLYVPSYTTIYIKITQLRVKI